MMFGKNLFRMARLAKNMIHPLEAAKMPRRETLLIGNKKMSGVFESPQEKDALKVNDDIGAVKRIQEFPEIAGTVASDLPACFR